MKQLYAALFVCISYYGTAQTQTTQQIGSTTVTIDTLISTMTLPWEISLESDDFLWATERDGIVSRIDLATGEKDTMLDLTNVVETQGESGLLGLALHPVFNITPEVFLVYTHGPVNGQGLFSECLVKYTYDQDGDTLIDPVIIIDNIPAGSSHDGSRLYMLSDQTLLMSTGEHNDPGLAQDSTSLAGKFLRFNLDGSIPHDNPDTTSYIYTMGHRNPQGITQLPSGAVVVSEHGPTTDDELQLLEAGNNYGWPLIYGFCDESFEDAPCATGLYTEPIYHWSPTIAPADLVYYENPSFPEWDGHLLMTTLNGQRLVVLTIDTATNTITDESQVFLDQFGRLRDIAVGPDKKIYIATNTGANGAQPIIRITPPYFASLNEHEEVAFTISPNPAADYVKVDLPLYDATIRILDLNGREVLSVKHLETNNKISLINLQQGFYMLEVVQPGMAPSQQRLQKI